MSSTTDDELLSTAQAVLDDPKSVYLNLLNATEPLKAYVNAASPDRVKALIEEKRHSRYLEDEAHKEINRQATEIIDLWKRLKRAEEALRRISAVSDVGGHIAAAYFKPAGEGE